MQLHDNKIVVYREKDSVAPVLPKPKHPLKVHVWAGISRRGTTRILIFEDIMDANFYINTILTTGLIPFINRVYIPWQSSSATRQRPKTYSECNKRILYATEHQLVECLAIESSDFNPIEMVWAMMKSRISKKEPRTKQGLISSINSFWREDMTISTCNNFIDHIFKDLPVALVIGGQATGDLPRKI